MFAHDLCGSIGGRRKDGCISEISIPLQGVEYRCGISNEVFQHFAPFFFFFQKSIGIFVLILVAFWAYFSNFVFVSKWIWLHSVLVYRSLKGIKKAVSQAFNNQILCNLMKPVANQQVSSSIQFHTG